MNTVIPFPNRTPTEGARSAYDALAPAYDAFAAGTRHDLWLAEIEAMARRHGLRGRRVLDIACGTGKSFLPLLERGYTIAACDSSPQMLRRALRKAPAVPLLVADMRALPDLGAYDLVTCLEDAFNCLLHPDDVRAGIAASLEPHGLAIWDVNTLALIRDCFSRDWVADRGEWFFAWRGTGSKEIGPGAVVEARLDAFRRRGSGWQRTSVRLKQRHWPVAEIARHAEASGLCVLEVGEDAGGKALFIARRAEV